MTPFWRRTEFFIWMLQASWQASVLILLVLLTHGLFGRRLTARGRSVLWLLVTARLLLPVSPGSMISLFNFARPEVAAPTVVRWLGRDSRPEKVSLGLSSDTATPVDSARFVANAILPSSSPMIKPSTPSLAHAQGKHVPWAMVLWALGALVLGVRFLWRNGRFFQQLQRCHEVADPRLAEVLSACQAVMGVRGRLRLVKTDLVFSPALYGLLRRRLLLPVSMVGRLGREEWRFVFLHELAHLKRWDIVLNWLMTCLSIIHWFNPVAWYAFRCARQERELACDELVLAKVQSHENKAYGEAILRVLEFGARPARLPGLLGILETGTHLEQRMRLIATFKGSTGSWTLVGGLGLILGLVTFTGAQTEESRSSSLAPPADVDVVEPETGLRYVAVKTVAASSEATTRPDGLALSPNGKFLLWSGRVVPLDGKPAFTLRELQSAGVDPWSASWSPDGLKIAFNAEGLSVVLPVPPATGRATSPVRKLLEEKGNWFRGKIYWSADSERILFVKWNRQMEREAKSISLRDGRLNPEPDYADFGLVSPDGKTIAYSLPQGGIWSRPIGGGAPRIIRAPSTGALYDDLLQWNSGGQWLVSAADGWGRQEIHFVRLSDRQSFDVVPPEAAGRYIGRSTNGAKPWFYRSSFEPRLTCTVVPLSGASVFKVGTFPGLEKLDGCYWSLDSGSVAVLGADMQANQQLWSSPITGGEPARFKMDSLGTTAKLLSLSRDNKRALYQVWSGTRALVQGWSGTNQGPERVDLYVAPISLKTSRPTGPGTLVFRGWQSAHRAAALGVWSPDGTRIAMPHKGDQGNELWILMADGGAAVRIAQTPDQLASQLQWSPDGRLIVFDVIAADRDLLQAVPAVGGPAKALALPTAKIPVCFQSSLISSGGFGTCGGVSPDSY